MQQFKNGLLGLAVGEAMGLPLINMSREKLLAKPVTEMTSGGELDVKKGTWGLTTEITLAIRETLLKHEGLKKTSFFKRLVEVDSGSYSIDKTIFSLDIVTERAIKNYKDGMDIDNCGLINTEENSIGALIMMYPVAFFAYEKKLKEKDIYILVKDIVELTHKHEINVIGCYIYTMYLIFLLRGKDKYASLSMLQCCDFSFFTEDNLQLYSRILKDSLKNIKVDTISTTGDIAPTVEAILYILINSNNYKQSILGAINLGGQTNIISALVGCMAGIIYKEEGIPDEWLKGLRGKDILDKFV